MLLQRAFRRDYRLRRIVGRKARHARINAPMVQDVRDVPNPIVTRLLQEAQDEIIILASFKSLAKPSDLLRNRRPIHAEVCNVILREEESRIPPRFEIRVEATLMIIDLVFVAVANIDIRMSEDLFS